MLCQHCRAEGSNQIAIRVSAFTRRWAPLQSFISLSELSTVASVVGALREQLEREAGKLYREADLWVAYCKLSRAEKEYLWLEELGSDLQPAGPEGWVPLLGDPTQTLLERLDELDSVVESPPPRFAGCTCFSAFVHLRLVGLPRENIATAPRDQSAARRFLGLAHEAFAVLRAEAPPDCCANHAVVAAVGACGLRGADARLRHSLPPAMQLALEQALAPELELEAAQAARPDSAHLDLADWLLSGRLLFARSQPAVLKSVESEEQAEEFYAWIDHAARALSVVVLGRAALLAVLRRRLKRAAAPPALWQSVVAAVQSNSARSLAELQRWLSRPQLQQSSAQPQVEALASWIEGKPRTPRKARKPKPKHAPEAKKTKEVQQNDCSDDTKEGQQEIENDELRLFAQRLEPHCSVDDRLRLEPSVFESIQKLFAKPDLLGTFAK